MRFYPLLVFVFTSSLMAQQPATEQTGWLPCHRPVRELKAALGLENSQVAALEALKLGRHEAQAPIVEQLRDQWRALNQALQSGQTDAAALGQMLLDIESLRVQRRKNDAHYDAQALAVLTSEQQEELKKLERALRLQPAARQAVWLGLLDRPKDIRQGKQADDDDPDSGLF